MKPILTHEQYVAVCRVEGLLLRRGREQCNQQMLDAAQALTDLIAETQTEQSLNMQIALTEIEANFFPGAQNGD